MLNANEFLFSMGDRMSIMDCFDSGLSILFSIIINTKNMYKIISVPTNEC